MLMLKLKIIKKIVKVSLKMIQMNLMILRKMQKKKSKIIKNEKVLKNAFIVF